MSHRLQTFAGYDASAVSDSVSRTAPSQFPPTGLPDATDTQLPPTPAPQLPHRRPLAQTNGIAPSPTTPQQPKHSKTKGPQPPSTGRKQDQRRGYGVLLGGGDDTGGGYTGVEGTTYDDLTGRTMDSELELKQLHNQILSVSANENEDRTYNSQTSDQTPDGTTPYDRAPLGRVPAGANLKQIEARTNALISERDDLKIEVDFYRRRGNHGDEATELIQLRKEKLAQIKKIMQSNEMIKNQNKALNELSHKYSSLANERAQDKELFEEELKSVQQVKEYQARELERLKHENATLQQQHGGDRDTTRSRSHLESDYEAQIAELKQDHAMEIYRLERERDELADKLDMSVDNSSRGMDMSRASGVMRQKNELIKMLETKVQEAEHDLEMAREERDHEADAREQLENDVREYQQHVADLEEDLQDAQQRLTEFERDHNQLADEMDAVAQEHRAVEEKLTNELQQVRDELTSWQLEFEKKDAELQKKINVLEQREEWVADLEYQIRAANHEKEQLESRLVDTEHVADDMENELKQLKQTVEQRDAELSSALREHDELYQEIDRQAQELRAIEADRNIKVDDLQALTVRVEDAETKLQTSERKNQALMNRISEIKEQHDELEARLVDTEALYNDAIARAEAHEAEIDKLVEEHKTSKAEIERLEDDLARTTKLLHEEQREANRIGEEYEQMLRDQEADFNSDLAEKEEELQNLERQLNLRRDELEDLKEDMQRMQDDHANQSVREGKNFNQEKYALGLKQDQLKRTNATLERELEAARKAVERQADLVKEKDSDQTKARAEIRELSGKLSAETQARLGVVERYETQARALQKAREEADEVRAKLDDLEAVRADETRSKAQAGEQTMRQVKERNTLLMSVYQSLGRVVSPEKLSQRRKEEESKPFTNFSIFHGSLLARLKRVSDLKVQFEQRAKEIEAGFMEQFGVLKRQQDAQTRRVNQLESSVKTANDKQALWRNRVQAKQTELDAVRSAHKELQDQIASMKSAQRALGPRSSSPNVSNSRINTSSSDWKVNVANNQRQAAEERAEEAKARHDREEAKMKERVRELEEQIKRLQRESREGSPMQPTEKSKFKKEIMNQIRRSRADIDRVTEHNRKLDEILAMQEESPLHPSLRDQS